MKGKTNKQRQRLSVLGMMSGTSLDGIDAAVLDTDGVDIFDFGETRYRAYGAQERAILKAALGCWPDAPAVAPAAEVVEIAHARVLAGMGATDAVGFHGQTLAHDPANKRTHQAGDGAVLAAVSGRRVVWDFRSNDVAMGGQGAPLAPAYHFALARWMGAVAPIGFLNLGGVGNLTVVDPTREAAETPGALFAFDTGPANAPIDDFVAARTGAAHDMDGALAAAGRADAAILSRLEADPYLSAPAPKSLDRDSFAWLGAAVEGLSVEDGAATLTEAAALCVARALESVPDRPERVLVAGGGRHNGALMSALRRRCAADIDAIEDIGLDGDMLEAQAFAFLAVRVLNGLPTSFPGTTGVAAAIGGGEVSIPE